MRKRNACCNRRFPLEGGDLDTRMRKIRVFALPPSRIGNKRHWPHQSDSHKTCTTLLLLIGQTAHSWTPRQ